MAADRGESQPVDDGLCRGYVALEDGPMLKCRKPAYHEGEPHKYALQTRHGQWVDIEWRMLFDAPDQDVLTARRDQP